MHVQLEPRQETQAAPVRGFSGAGVVSAFFFSRFIVFLIASLCLSAIITSVPAREGLNYHLWFDFSVENLASGFNRLFLSADGSWYLEIAELGYHPGPYTDAEPRNWVFFPLFPLAVRAASFAFGSPVVAAVVLSNICFLLALAALRRLGSLRGHSEREVRFALWLLAMFPVSYFFSAPLSESLFLFLIAWAWTFAAEGRVAVSSVFMSLATAARPTGLLMLPAYLAMLEEEGKLRSRRGIAAICIAPIGAVVYLMFLQLHTGNFLAFAGNQNAWGRTVGGIAGLPGAYLEQLSHAALPWNLVFLNAAALLLAAAVAGCSLLSKHPAARKSDALLILIPLLSAAGTGTLQSMARLAMVCFPIFFMLGRIPPASLYGRIIYAASSMLLAAMTAMYALHVTAGMA